MRRCFRAAMPFVVAVLVGVSGAILVGGWGWTRTAATGGPPSARAVQALTGDDPRAVPADFAAVMGYQPAAVADAGHRELIRSDGGCSSPWGDTRYGFGIACRQHDLGYDLLRYSTAVHRPLGPWARRAVDARFRDAVRRRCSASSAGVGCRATADAYVAAVGFNSWRQGWGDPVVESVPAVLAPGLAGLLAGVLAGVMASSARARRSVAGLLRVVVDRPVSRQRAGRLLLCAVALALCLQPAAVPHPLWTQALMGGLVAAQAYLLATLASRGVGRISQLCPRVVRRWVPRARPAGWLLAGTTLVLVTSTVASARAQVRLDGAVGATPRNWGLLLLGTPAAVLVGVVAVGLPVGLLHVTRRVGRTLLITLGRARPPLRRWLAVAALMPALVLGLGGAAAAATVPASQRRTDTSQTEAFDPIPGDAGARGRAFLAGLAPVAAPGPGGAVRPVRVYVGRDQGDSADARARLAVRELRRAGGFDRSVLLIVIPTGSGWVNQQAVAALERSRHGDVATVAVQYAASPSWVSYLRGGQGVQQTVRAVIEAVRAQVSRRPPPQRPTVLVYGESLGAWGGLLAYPDPDQLLRRVDGALWVGVPPGTPPRSSRTVAASARVVTVLHRDDPVPAWTPRLLLHPEPAWHHPWLPVVSFWRETADVVAADSTPPGHGHRYGAELADAWDALLANQGGSVHR